jgi:hypothetical protein
MAKKTVLGRELYSAQKRALNRTILDRPVPRKAEHAIASLSAEEMTAFELHLYYELVGINEVGPIFWFIARRLGRPLTKPKADGTTQDQEGEQ